MSRIVFFCIPAHGHTNPTLMVVRELVVRGHEVWYYSYEMMRRKIEDVGAKFIPCDGYDAQQKLTPEESARLGADLALSTRILVDTTLALDEMVCRDMERLKPDCIVADSMAVWGKAVALKLAIPFVSSTTTFAFNQSSAKTMKQSPMELIRMLLSMPRINRELNRLRSRGYPVRNILDIIANDEETHTIVYTSPEFQPCSETFPDNYAFVGPSIRPAGVPLEKTREKRVYISMGTVNNEMRRLYRCCVEALSESGHQVILSVGDRVRAEELGVLPDNVEVYQQVDQIAVLEQTDVFITHCGMNSVSEALYFGVPLVMVPQTPEQCAVAARVVALGAGVYLNKTDRASVKKAVTEVLTQPAYRENAEAISAGFRRCAQAQGAADHILKLCK